MSRSRTRLTSESREGWWRPLPPGEGRGEGPRRAGSVGRWRPLPPGEGRGEGPRRPRTARRLGATAALGLALTIEGARPPPVLEAAPSSPREPRLLVLGLDGVPYGLVAQLTDPARGEAALFRGFAGPVPMISTFPSTTNMALSGLLEPFGVERSQGYEVRFFDREKNRVRGGGPVSYHRLEFPWRNHFDHGSKSLLVGMVAKLRPVEASIQHVEGILRDFLAGEEEAVFAYVGSTDGAGHLKGPASLAAVLEALDAAIGRMRRNHPDEPFHVVLFSDHGQAGGEPLVNVRPEVRRRLREAGYRVIDQLVGTRDVAIPELGMVSSFAVYTRPGREEGVRRLLAGIAGVELCASRRDGGVVVEGGGGSAWIGRRPAGGGPDEGEALWSYQPLDGGEGAEGDPLGYAPVVASLRARAGEPHRRWFPDGWWFDETAGAHYPDALYRLARAFELVENPASVLCSAAPGHMYAAWRTEAAARLSIGRLRWTHGSLRAEPTLGFLLTDLPGYRLNGPVRFDETLAPVARRLDRPEPPPAQVTAAPP